MKKIITFATAASLLMGSMTMPVYGATFADIDTVTWSGFKPFLNEAAELNLMKGTVESNGKRYCYPRNNVTYIEAVQLMYSIMRAYTGEDVTDAKINQWKTVISAYDIDSWAFNCITYGLDKGILTTSDLEKMRGNKRQATREEVAVIFGKAMDTVKGYDTKSNPSLSYADKSTVSAAALPYVELLNRADLMVGDTDNKFNAQAKITRAEMAVLSVKTYKKLQEAGKPETGKEATVTGTVISSMVMQNGDLFISMKANDGTSLSLFGAKSTVKPKYNGMQIGFDQIGAGDTVRVTYKDVNMSALEVTYSKKGIAQATEKTGELVKLTDSRVTILEGSKEVEYRLDDDVTVKLDGDKSTISKVKNALEDAKYDVTLKLDKDEYVQELLAVMNENNPTEGYVYDLDDDEIVIQAGSKTYKYPLAKDLDITYKGSTVRFSKLADEYDDYNYFVSLELDKNLKVTEIKIESMEDEYSGTLTFINSNRIEFTAGGDDYSYKLNSDVKVKIDGKSSSVSKLRDEFRDDKAFTVSVELDRNDYVTEIEATPKFDNNNDGVLKDLDKDEIVLLVGEKEYTYDLAKDIEVKINGKSKDLEDLMDHLDEYSFELELEFDEDGDVSEIHATLTEVYEGQLRDVIPAQDKITVTAAGLHIDLEVAGSVDITLEGDDIDLDELNEALYDAWGGTTIYVELDYNSSGKVDEIKAAWQHETATLESVDEDDDEITVKTEKNKKETYDVSSKVDITYKLSSSVDEDDYKKKLNYGDDLEGLKDFLDDCEEANDDCEVTLTLDEDEEYVIRIKAMAVD